MPQVINEEIVGASVVAPCQHPTYNEQKSWEWGGDGGGEGWLQAG